MFWPGFGFVGHVPSLLTAPKPAIDGDTLGALVPHRWGTDISLNGRTENGLRALLLAGEAQVEMDSILADRSELLQFSQ